MILHTSDNVESRLRELKRLEQQEKMQEWVSHELLNSQYIDDPEMDPTNAQKRIGRPLHHDVVEKKLKSLNPNLVFKWHSFNSSKKVAYFRDEHVVFESGVMPERSILACYEEMVPVKDIYNNPNFGINRKDLTPGKASPYWTKVKKPGRELTRGWRTLLIYLVKMGALTPTQAELAFGSADNREWQNHMGKATHLLPW